MQEVLCIYYQLHILLSLRISYLLAQKNHLNYYLLNHTDPDKVFFQLDIGWIYIGKADPAYYFEKYPGRFLSLHVKDDKELGESGNIDFQSVLDMKDQAGVKYCVIEVENYNFTPLESVRKSLEYMKTLKF